MRFLPAKGPGADATREGNAGGGARWARWGRCARDFPMATTWTTILDLLDGDIEGRGQPGAARRRWRRSGRRAGARAVGRIQGRGARGIVGLVGRAAAQGRDGGAAWERAAAQGRGSVGAGRAQAVPAGAHRRARFIGVGGGYSLKLASIAATRSFSASMSCWFTSSIFCKSAGEASST